MRLNITWSGKNYLLLFILFVMFPLDGNSRTPQSECNALLKKGVQLNYDSQYKDALELLFKAQSTAEKYGYDYEMFHIKNYIGIVYNNLFNSGEALHYYNEALEIAKKNKFTNEIPLALNNVAILYLKDKEYGTAIKYYRQAFDLAKQAGKMNNYAQVGINIADIYNILGDYKMAKQYLFTVKPHVEGIRWKSIWSSNMAESLLIENDIPGAKAVMKEWKDKAFEAGQYCDVCIAKVLSKIAIAEKDWPTAIHYAKLGLKQSEKLHEHLELYEQIAAIYVRANDYRLGMVYKDSVLLVKDSISQVNKKGMFESYKIKMKVLEYENELKNSKLKYGFERKIYIIAIAVILLLCVFVYRWSRTRIYKQKQEKILAENKQKITDLELEKKKKEHLLAEQSLESLKQSNLLNTEILKSEISEKNRELSSKVIHLLNRNETIKDTINFLSNLPETPHERAIANHIKLLKSDIKDDQSWNEFISYFEKVNPSFLKILKQNFSDLNGKDIRFLCYVYINLETKEVASILNITYNAAKKRKLRIKEKMGLGPEDDLYEFLLKLA